MAQRKYICSSIGGIHWQQQQQGNRVWISLPIGQDQPVNFSQTFKYLSLSLTMLLSLMRKERARALSSNCLRCCCSCWLQQQKRLRVGETPKFWETPSPYTFIFTLLDSLDCFRQLFVMKATGKRQFCEIKPPIFTKTLSTSQILHNF